MAERTFDPGFRLSTRDVVVIALAIAGTVALATTGLLEAAFVVAFVVAHFFLFCNVFRLARPGELVWTAVFLLCAGGTLTWQLPGWLFTVVASLLTTVLVVALETRKSSYHGVGWQRINPGLTNWWESH